MDFKKLLNYSCPEKASITILGENRRGQVQAGWLIISDVFISLYLIFFFLPFLNFFFYFFFKIKLVPEFTGKGGRGLGATDEERAREMESER